MTYVGLLCCSLGFKHFALFLLTVNCCSVRCVHPHLSPSPPTSADNKATDEAVDKSQPAPVKPRLVDRDQFSECRSSRLPAVTDLNVAMTLWSLAVLTFIPLSVVFPIRSKSPSENTLWYFTAKRVFGWSSADHLVACVFLIVIYGKQKVLAAQQNRNRRTMREPRHVSLSAPIFGNLSEVWLFFTFQLLRIRKQLLSGCYSSLSADLLWAAAPRVGLNRLEWGMCPSGSAVQRVE